MMNIRRATVNDVETIAGHLLLAMEDIVYTFIRQKDPAKARELLLYFVGKENNQYSYQNCWVAEEGPQVVAAVNVYDGAQLNALRQPVVDYIRSRFYPGFVPDDETQAGEYYIDSLGVHPDFQGRGVGSKMLQFLIDEYVFKQGQTLGLLVDEENPGAKRLYVKLGFMPVEKKVLFGKQMEHLQRKADTKLRSKRGHGS